MSARLERKHNFRALINYGIIPADKILQTKPVGLLREESLLHNLAFDGLAKKDIRPTDYARLLFLPFEDVEEIMPSATDFISIEEKQAAAADQTKEISFGNLVLKIFE